MADFDLAIIGGGINGAGLARDAAGRGIRVLLVEMNDLGSGTSSASSKLIHGGLRYLEHGAFRLVREALSEREVLLRMSAKRPAGAKNTVAGTVYEIGYRGEMSAYKVRLADGSLMKVSIANVNARGRAPYAEGDDVWLSWPPEAAILLAS